MDNQCVYSYKKIAAILEISPDTLKRLIGAYKNTPTPFPIYAWPRAKRPIVYAYRDEVLAWRKSLPYYRPGSATEDESYTPFDTIERDEHIITFR